MTVVWYNSSSMTEGERTPKFRNVTWWRSNSINHKMSFDGHVLDDRAEVIFKILYRLLPTLEEKTWGENQLGQLSIPSWVCYRRHSHNSPGNSSRKGLQLLFRQLLFILYNHIFTRMTLNRLLKMIFWHYCFRQRYIRQFTPPEFLIRKIITWIYLNCFCAWLSPK